jgi:hypothetical protein
VDGNTGYPPHTEAWRRHVDRTRPHWQQTEEGRRITVAECGLIAARQHGGHVARVQMQQRVSDRIHPGMKPVQATRRQPVADRTSAYPCREELRSRYDTMLAGRKPPDDLIKCHRRWARFSTYSVAFA